MKTGIKMEWAITGAALVLFLLLLVLFGFNHPHSDDFSYASLAAGQGFLKASQTMFNTNAGRFISSAVLFLNPMRYGQIETYHWYTAGIFIAFVVSLFIFFRLLFRAHLSFRKTVSLFALVFLSFFSFMPSLHEFCFWLCGEATYLIATMFCLWAVVLHVVLNKEKNADRKSLWFLMTLLSVGVAGCSETGVFIYSFILLFSYVYRRQKGYPNRALYIHTILFLLLTLFVFAAPGNRLRHEGTPFAGNVVLGISGGLYASAFWLSKWIIIIIPLTFLHLFILGKSLLPWAKSIHSAVFNAKNIVRASLLFFIGCQMLIVWMSGSTPEARSENIFFLFLLLSFLLSAQLMLVEFENVFENAGAQLKKLGSTFSFVYFVCVFIVLPNNAVSALFDVSTGAAASFDQANTERYQSIRANAEQIVRVRNIPFEAQLLYFPAISCDSTIDQNDVPRLALADYFGKKWIYEYPCSSEPVAYSLKSILKQTRQRLFQDEKK